MFDFNWQVVVVVVVELALRVYPSAQARQSV